LGGPHGIAPAFAHLQSLPSVRATDARHAQQLEAVAQLHGARLNQVLCKNSDDKKISAALKIDA
jgi:hypothetical protein